MNGVNNPTGYRLEYVADNVEALINHERNIYHVKTVANGGSPLGDGSWENPFSLPSQALAVASEADCVFVHDGSYDENGASTGLTIDVTSLCFWGLGRVRITNTNTTDGSRVCGITADKVSLVNISFAKGESTADNAALVVVDGADNVRIQDCGFVFSKADQIGVKLTGGANGCGIRGSFDRPGRRNTYQTAAPFVNSNYGIAILLDDCTQCAITEAQIRDVDIGIKVNADAAGNLIDGTSTITDCNTGIRIESGANTNTVVAIVTNCDLNIDDDSRNTTNTVGSHHEHIYPVSDGEGTAGDPLTFTSDASDNTHGAATTRYYWGDVGIVLPINTITSQWGVLGWNIYIDTFAKYLQFEVLRVDPAYRTNRNGGNLWDEGETALTVADSSLFEVDDLVWIVSAAIPNGEILRVTDVTGSIVTIERETSQFGAPNTGVRFNHTADNTPYMYVARRESNGWHGTIGGFSGASAKDEIQYRLHEAQLMPPNSGLIGRLMNKTDNITATAEAETVYDDFL